jgi:hypothetical protein
MGRLTSIQAGGVGSPRFNVISYGDGATGDGVTNATTAIQAAHAAATAAGGDIWFPPGTYLCNGTTFNAGTRLVFQAGAMLSIPNGQTITINGQIDAGLHQIFSCAGTGKVIILTGQEIQVEWFGVSTAGLQPALNAGIHVRLSTSFTSTTKAVVIPATCKSLVAENVKITCSYEQTPGAGQITEMYLLANGVNDFALRGLELEYTGTFNVAPPPYSGKVCGLIANNCANLTLDNLYFHGFNDYGALLTPNIDWGAITPVACTNVKVINSRLNYNRVGGLNFQLLYGLTCIDSDFNYNGFLDPLDNTTGYGIVATPGNIKTNIKIVNCNCSGNATNGIDSHTGGEIIIQGNDLGGNWKRAIAIVAEGALPLRAVITGNKIHDMHPYNLSGDYPVLAFVLESAGQAVDNQADILIAGNMIYDFGHTLAGVEQACPFGILADSFLGGRIRIEGNMVDVADVYALFRSGQGDGYCILGTHNGPGNSATLIDTTKNFVALGLAEGMPVFNETDGSKGFITAITTTTNPNDTITAALGGGAENDWDVDDAYKTTKYSATLEICNNTFRVSGELTAEPFRIYSKGYRQMEISGNRFELASPAAGYPLAIYLGDIISPDLTRIRDNTFVITNPVIANPLDVDAMPTSYKTSSLVMKDNWQRANNVNSLLPDWP